MSAHSVQKMRCLSPLRSSARPGFGSHPVKPKTEIASRTPRGRLVPLTRRLCSNFRPVKPMPGRGSAKTRLDRPRHLLNPFMHQSIQPFHPWLKSGKTGSNQKMDLWRLPPARCRPGPVTRRLYCQVEVRPRPGFGRVKPGKTKFSLTDPGQGWSAKT